MDRHTPRTARAPRFVALALAVALAAALAACGVDGEAGADDPTPTEPGPTPTAPGPLELPADQVVWQDSSGGGMVPPSPVAPHLAAVTIYGDGRAFRTAAPSKRSHLDPVPIEVGTVSPGDLAALVDAAEASGLFASDDTDFGDPMVTDAGSQVVRFHGGGDVVEVHAYAFEDDFDGGLTDAQRDRREALRELLEQAERSVDDLEAYEPDRVAVAEVDGRSYGGSNDRPRTWPGPSVDTVLEPTDRYGASGCGELEGAAATAVWAAALDDPGTTWSVDGERRELVVAALLPGQEPCADHI